MVSDKGLLMLAALVLIVGTLTVNLSTGEFNIMIAGVAITLVILFIVASMILKMKIPRGDPLFLPLILFLGGIGLTEILRLKPQLFWTQSLWFIIGITAFVITAVYCRKLERLLDYKYICGFIGISLLLVTIIFGTEIGGNKNWVIIGPLHLQLSEFAKLFVVLFLAGYLDERREVLAFGTQRYGIIELPTLRFIAPILSVWGLTMLILVLQRDLGSALLFFVTTMLMTYIACGRVSYVVFGLLLFSIGATLCYFLFSHVQTRIDIWLNQWADPSGKGYQVVQSLFALGTGGILGTGLGYGFPELIPEVHTDFIFSAIGEEMGLSGTASIIFAYIILVYRGFKVAMSTKSTFCMLATSGLVVFISLQIFLIIGGVTKFVPLTGVTLPFISYGGSSVVSNFILVGILFAVSEVKSSYAK